MRRKTEPSTDDCQMVGLGTSHGLDRDASIQGHETSTVMHGQCQQVRKR